jgi:undecaprenyl phosphate-alpha-L-ara4N flippase subunit ArnE
MNLNHIFSAVLCAFGLASGQVLFKMGARQLEDISGAGFIVSCLSNKFVIMAIVLYAFITLFWIGLLRSANLSGLFPVIALVYVIVPLMSVTILKEPYNLSLIIGTVLIVSGVLVITRAQV